VTEANGLRAYFRDARPTVATRRLENANGLPCGGLPRKTSLADHTNTDVDDVVSNLAQRREMSPQSNIDRSSRTPTSA
jgi:hypothetical protein